MALLLAGLVLPALLLPAALFFLLLLLLLLLPLLALAGLILLAALIRILIRLLTHGVLVLSSVLSRRDLPLFMNEIEACAFRVADTSLGAMLFALSVIGIFLNRRNLIVLLMAIELMLLAVNLNFVAFSHYLPLEADRMAGQVFVFFILTVAAAESAIGLAILVVLFRNRASIKVDELDELKG